MPDKPGIYIYAKKTTSGEWSAIYVGEAQDIADRIEEHSLLRNDADRCIMASKPTHIHVNIMTMHIDERQAEEKDLIKNYKPPCNTQHKTT